MGPRPSKRRPTGKSFAAALVSVATYPSIVPKVGAVFGLAQVVAVLAVLS